MKLHRLNERSLLLTLSDTPDLACQSRLWRLQRALASSSHAGEIEELVPGMGNLLVRCSNAAGLPDIQEALSRLLGQAQTAGEDEPEEDGRLIEIPVQYGGETGPDLLALASFSGLEPEALIALHANREYRVYCLGFRAGFAYMGDLDERLHMPRRSTPRPRIPAGALAVADRFCGIYPAAGPGGWHIIGHTRMRMFDITAESPCLLRAGDRVRFVPEASGEPT